MTMDEVYESIPEASREGAKKAIAEFIAVSSPLAGVDSREKAFDFIQKSAPFKAAMDEEIRARVAAHDDKFKAEKLPGLIEEEVKKRNPAKDPRDIALEKMQAKLDAMEKTGLRERLKVTALKLAAEKDIPIDLVESFIGDSEEETVEKIERIAKVVTDWRDAKIEAVKKEAFGNTGKPKGGTPPAATPDLDAQIREAEKSGNGALLVTLLGKKQEAMKSKE